MRMRGGDVDSVDRGIGQQGLVSLVGGRDAKLRGECLGRLSRAAGDSAENAGLRSFQASGKSVGDIPGSDDSPIQFILHDRSSGRSEIRILRSRPGMARSISREMDGFNGCEMQTASIREWVQPKALPGSTNQRDPISSCALSFFEPWRRPRFFALEPDPHAALIDSTHRACRTEDTRVCPVSMVCRRSGRGSGRRGCHP